MTARRFSPPKVRLCLTCLVLATLLLSSSLYYVQPVRNAVLKPVWPSSWRSISTADILNMRKSQPPKNVTNLSHCDAKVSPYIQISEVPNHSKMLVYHGATPENEFFKDELYARFLPGIDEEDRKYILWVYLILAHALEVAKIPFFFVNGSLLGVFRHGGGIPWDTDIDLAVNVSDWKSVRQVLSCIDGFRLETKPFMHWKFYPQDKSYPFIDLFFYTENDVYLWSLTDYEMKSLAYEKSDVLPLSTALFEGVQVPVPARTDRIVRQEFETIEYCYPPSLNYKTGARHKQSYVLCSSLAKVYPIQNLQF